MKKIILSVFIASILLTFFSGFVFAEENTELIRDNSAVLEQAEKNILEKRLTGIFENYGLSLILISENSLETDINSELSLEAQESVSFPVGAVFLINTNSGEISIKSFGEWETLLDVEYCGALEEIVKEKLNIYGYYEAYQNAVYNIESRLSGEEGLYDGSAYMPSVSDGAGYLSESQVREISEKLDSLRENYMIDVALVTETDLSADTAEQAARDLYDYCFYGIGENDDGILFYICKNTREYYFITYGYGKEVFDDYALDYIENTVVSYLASDEYYEAFLAYADTAKDILQASLSSENEYNPVPPAGGNTNEDYFIPHNGNEYAYTSHEFSFTPFLIAIAASFAIALFMTYTKQSAMNTAKPQNLANNYVKDGSFIVTRSRDVFLYSTLIKHKKPKNNTNHSSGHSGSSGRSGFSGHSSSGRSHGGRGGRF